MARKRSKSSKRGRAARREAASENIHAQMLIAGLASPEDFLSVRALKDPDYRPTLQLTVMVGDKKKVVPMRWDKKTQLTR